MKMKILIGSSLSIAALNGMEKEVSESTCVQTEQLQILSPNVAGSNLITLLMNGMAIDTASELLLCEQQSRSNPEEKIEYFNSMCKLAQAKRKELERSLEDLKKQWPPELK